MNTVPQRYTGLAIILHWVMALAFLLMLVSGFVMAYGGLPPGQRFDLYQWHKSLGVVLLLAFFLRLGLRLVRRPPPLPASFPRWEAVAAKAGHRALYLCMIIMPVSGWIVVSASVYGLPTIVFGLFEWPHVPGLTGDKAVEQGAGSVHLVMALAFVLLIAVHIAAVVKHAVVDRHNLLARLWWVKGNRS